MFIYLLKFDWSFNASYFLVSIEVKHFNYRNICDLWTTHTEIQNTTWKEMLKKISLISNLVLIFYFDFILINVYIYLNASWWLICLQLYMNWRVLTTKVTLNSLFNDIIFLLFSTIHWPANNGILLFHFQENPKHTWKWHLFITSLQIYCTLYNDKSTLLCTLPYTISTLMIYWAQYILIY